MTEDTKPESTTKRDDLAADRTELANERTLLAYIRTSLTFLVVGATAIKFFGSTVLAVVGWGFIAISAGALWVGVSRFNRMRGRIDGRRNASR